MKYQVMPDLTPIEYEALKADIEERGVLVPVEVDETGAILDGHHRVKAWQELRSEGANITDYPRLIRRGLTEEQKRNHARSLNVLRRHLSSAQRNEVMIEMRRDLMTIQDIAEAMGVSVGTVHDAVSGVELFKSEKLTGKDGKKRPAKYNPRKPKPQAQPTIFAANAKDEKRALKIAAELPVNGDSVITTKNASDIAKDIKRQEKREQLTRAIENLPAPPSINGELATNTIAIADVAELIDLLPAESVDMIFTDPPYHDEYVDLYGNLAALANHVLKPGGYLMTYIGKMFMPDVMCQLARHLEYVSIYAVFQPFSTSRIVKHNIFENWRPILAYKKPGVTAVREWAQDVVRGERDKEYHDWQQDEQAPEQYIASYTKPGDLVLDPFCGGGTTAAVCKRIGRYYLSFDTNPDAVKIALSRLGGISDE